MATGTDRLPNYEQMERLIAATEISTPAIVRIPVQTTFEFTYDGTAKTIGFNDFDEGRVMVTGGTNIEPGFYVATAYLRSVSDKWTDGTTKGKTYQYTIRSEVVEATSWENATDEKIDELLTASEAGEIDLVRDYGWMVGDERTITLNAIPATGGSGTETYTVGETQAQQEITLVLMDTDHYELVTPTSGGRTKSEFVVGVKDALANTGYMNSTNTNAGSWDAAARRAWCNYGFRSALPEYLRKHFKEFCVDTASEYNSSAIKESHDYFSLFAEYEVFGARSYSNAIELVTLSPIAYYWTAANRMKKKGLTSEFVYWWLRSPYSGDTGRFCSVGGGGAATGGSALNAHGLAPFGCL